ncbi:hypothetical protein [Mesorhizobium sp. ISC15]|uniref:hypothetical protein n=1 Tax=Mesorhizobium sp. ISC15 TaxID=3076429 RepID=UPI00301B711D
MAVASIGFVLADESDQAVEAEVCEGRDLLIVGAVDPDVAVHRFHLDIDFPQQLRIIAKHLGSEREGVDSGDRSHGQAVSLAWDRGQDMIAEEYWAGVGCFGA